MTHLVAHDPSIGQTVDVDGTVEDVQLRVQLGKNMVHQVGGLRCVEEDMSAG